MSVSTNTNNSILPDAWREAHASMPSNAKPFILPFRLPFSSSNEIAEGHAYSLGFSYGPKYIAIDSKKLNEETTSMQKFILMRKIALFNKDSRILAIPVIATVIGITFTASTVLFTSTILSVTINAVVAIMGGYLLHQIQQKNRQYADKEAFVTLIKNNENGKAIGQDIINVFAKKIDEENSKNQESFISRKIQYFVPKSSSQIRFEALQNIYESHNKDESTVSKGSS